MTDTTTADTMPAAAVVGDPRPAFAQAADLAISVASAIRADQLSAPTPCDGIDVRRLLDHLAMVFGRVEAAGRGVALDEWPGEETTAGPDWVPTLLAAGARAVAAWADDARLAELVELPWATMPGADALGMYVNEVVVHTWDLATATGQAPDWDDAVIAVADACIRTQLPVADRGPIWEAARSMLPEGVPWTDPFADAVPVAEDASAIERLVAWNGRRA